MREYTASKRIKSIGDFKKLPDGLQQILKKLESRTESYQNMYLNIAIAYGGQQELLTAIKRIARSIQERRIDIEHIVKNDLLNGGYKLSFFQPLTLHNG